MHFSSACLLLLCVVLLGVWETQADPVCYGELGCFQDGAPFKGSGRPFNTQPQSPDYLEVQHRLYTRSRRDSPAILDARHPENFTVAWPHYEAERQTKFIIHGFLNTVTNVLWLKEMANELLSNGDYNVIVVDWHKGNQNPYWQAVGNTRVVGAQIAQLINTISKTLGQPTSTFHLIGHSLGAHTGGYAGERIVGLARITGLDPAGPYYENTDPEVRLDPTDATYVDVIHSDGKELIQMGFGLLEEVGHADYYPNLGHDQPGCSDGSPHDGNDKGTSQDDNEFISCNHDRSIKFFIESINSPCHFLAFPCDNEQDFAAGKCQSCDGTNCGQMGFHSDSNIPASPTLFYLRTAPHTPFCEAELGVSVRLAAGHTNEQGLMKVKLYGDQGTTDWIVLNTKLIDFQPGTTYSYTVGFHSDIGTVSKVDLSWHHSSPWTSPLKWNPFGLRHPTLAIQEVDFHVLKGGNKQIHRMCVSSKDADDSLVETDGTVTLDGACSS